jgi:hypothetical protein
MKLLNIRRATLENGSGSIANWKQYLDQRDTGASIFVGDNRGVVACR